MSTTPKAETPIDLVRASSPEASVSSLRSVSSRLRSCKLWLDEAHPYNNIKTLGSASNVHAAQLGEYIACSAPLHLTDGWNYLSRAFDAITRGDRNIAYHLAYYAELRAAMSLLAAEGIGVFRNWHIALNKDLQVTRIRTKGTHKAAWDLLSAWSQEGRAGNLLNAISLEATSMSDWLYAIGVGEVDRQILADAWLKAWSIDLQRFIDDRDRRNEMSYRPSRIRTPAPPPIDPDVEMIEPLFNSWTALEPLKDKGSVALDTVLLHKAIVLVTETGQCNYLSFNDAVKSLQNDMPKSLYDALNQETPSNAAIFYQAERKGVSEKAVTPILARSLLMLRLASASTASLLTRAEVSKSDLEFWWSVAGTDLGLWDAPTDIETFADLWIDVAEAKDDADENISIEGISSVRSVISILSREAPLTQFSRAPMWLLGLD